MKQGASLEEEKKEQYILHKRYDGEYWISSSLKDIWIPSENSAGIVKSLLTPLSSKNKPRLNAPEHYNEDTKIYDRPNYFRN